MDFVTIKDVELCSAGMQWPSAGGLVTLTLDHIADAARAFEDPLIVPARLKIGHVDPRFADPDVPDHDPFFDGEPAFGSVLNGRLINDGATLVGDYANVPVWLAEVLPSAYPNRSIEGAYSIVEGAGGKLEARWDVETNGGKKYSFVLTACALLGIQRPAVQDLEDLRYLLTEGGGVVVTGDGEQPADLGGVPVAVSMGAVDPLKLSGAGGVALEADVDKVLDVFYSEFAVDEKYWWWVRSVRVDPNVLVVDDDAGSLWSIPIESDGDQNITFGTPTRVLQTFTPAPAAAAALAAAAQAAPDAGHTVKAFAARAQTVPGDRKDGPEGGVKPSGNNSGMDFKELSAKQRARLTASLDLGEDATDAEITEALDAEGEPTPDPVVEPEVEPVVEPEAAPDDTTVAVDKTVLAELQGDAKAGREARNKQVADAREATLKAALAAGKITPASKGAWETKLKATPEATAAELEALPEGLVPVDKEVGHGGGEGVTTSATALDMSEEERLFPQLRGVAARES